MYKTIVRAGVRRGLQAISAGDPSVLIKMATPTCELAFPGDNSWAAMFRPVVKGQLRHVTHRGHRGVSSVRRAVRRRGRSVRSRGHPCQRSAVEDPRGGQGANVRAIHRRAGSLQRSCGRVHRAAMGPHRELGGLRRLRAGRGWDRTKGSVGRCRDHRSARERRSIVSLEDAGSSGGNQLVEASRWGFASGEIRTGARPLGNVEQSESGDLQRRSSGRAVTASAVVLVGLYQVDIQVPEFAAEFVRPPRARSPRR